MSCVRPSDIVADLEEERLASVQLYPQRVSRQVIPDPRLCRPDPSFCQGDAEHCRDRLQWGEAQYIALRGTHGMPTPLDDQLSWLRAATPDIKDALLSDIVRLFHLTFEDMHRFDNPHLSDEHRAFRQSRHDQKAQSAFHQKA